MIYHCFIEIPLDKQIQGSRVNQYNTPKHSTAGKHKTREPSLFCGYSRGNSNSEHCF